MTYSLAQLAALAGVSSRTVRFYVAQGLLRGPDGAGPAARYDDGHLARLRLIRRMQAQHLPLAEIRRRLEDVGDEELAALASVHEIARAPDSALDYIRGLLEPTSPASMPPQALGPPPSWMPPAASESTPPMPRLASEPAAIPPPAPASAQPPAQPPEPPSRSQWERVSLAPDVELHIRRPLSRHQNKRVDRLIAIARELLEEEGS